MSSGNTNPDEEGAGPPPTEEDLDSDVGTIFSDEEGGERCKEIDDDDEDDCVDGGQVSDEESGSSSGESDDGSEKCPICLQRFTDQEIGSPEMCEHQFCLRCITAWSKKVATCPIDRKFFSTIIVKKQWDGEVVRIENVQTNAQSSEQQYDSTPTYCEVCGRCDREERLLLCDGCDLGYHLECLDPPLEYVPIEDWYCPSCIAAGIQSDDEPEVIPSSSTSRAPVMVRIPRTLQNERILQSIDVPSQDAIQDVIEAVMQGINAANTTPSTRTRRRTTTPRKSRKSGSRKRKSTSRSTTGGTKKRRSKRKNRRRRRLAVDKRPNTARGRIAHHLGIKAPLKGQKYLGLPPACRSAGGASHSNSDSLSASNISNLRYSAGITPLRMFGNDHDLSDLLESYSDDEGGPTSVATARLPALHRSRGASLKGPPEIVASTSSAAASSTSGTCDVLGSILKKQYIFLNDKNVKISRDGTLVPSISSSNLPSTATTVSPIASKTSNTTTTTSPSSSPEGGQVNRVQPRMTTCATNNDSNNEIRDHTPNQSQSVGNVGETGNSETSAGVSSNRGSYDNNSASGGGNSAFGSSNTGSSGGAGGPASDALEELWGGDSQAEAEDDDFNIYSDIEEQSQDAETTDANTENPAHTEASNAIETSKDNSEVNPEEIPVPAVRKSSQESSNNHSHKSGDEHDSDLDEMVIDEEDSLAAGAKHHRQQSPQKEAESQGAKAAARLGSEENNDIIINLPPCAEEDEEQGGGDETPLKDETSSISTDANMATLPESPESIPLPDSPPPEISDTEEIVVEGRVVEGLENLSRENVSKAPPREYDPSQPLTSSDEDENSKRNLASVPSSSSNRRKSSSPQQLPSQRKKLMSVQSRNAALARQRGLSPRKEMGKSARPSGSAAGSSGDLDLSSIPIPPEENRRPVIHFSIPKRHNLIPISSLMKRQKGVARKESKGDGSTLNFQSEISKAFGSGEAPAEGSGDEGRTDEENLPRISLVAEIFGSDEEDEEEEVAAGGDAKAGSASQAEKPEEQEGDVDTSAKPAPVDSAIDVNSGRWKTNFEEVKDPEPPAPVTTSVDTNGVANDTGSPARNPEAEDELEIIEIVTLTPRQPNRRFLAARSRGGVETISDTSNSDIEVIDEVSTPTKTKSRDRDRSSSGSRSRSRTRRRSRKRRHSASSESFDEDGGFPDGSLGTGEANDRKRRKDKRQKERLKKRRVGSKERSSQGESRRHSGGAGLHDGVSSPDEDGDDAISWKKPSKKADRNYRDGRPKSSRSNNRDSDRSISPGYRNRRERGSGSPRQRDRSPSYKQSHSRYSDRLSRSVSRSRASWGRRRSRSGSSANSYGSFSRSSSRRHHARRPSMSPHVLGHSRSPSRSPEAIRPRSSHVRRRTRSISRDRSDRHHHRKTKLSRSRSPNDSLSRKKSKHSSKSSSTAAVGDSSKKKKSKLSKKTDKAAALLKARRKEKEQRLKDKSERRKLSKEGVEDGKLFGGKSKSGKDKGEKKKRKREKSLSPVKAIVADGDSIVVSLSFQKETSSRSSVPQTERSSSGKSSGKKLKESKQSRASSKLKESSTKAKSPSVSKQLMDLGAEDLSSNSEGSTTTATTTSLAAREKETSAAKVSSSGDGSTGEGYKAVGSSAKHQDDSAEVQGDSVVTSTRDSLEPSGTTEDDYPNSATSPSHSKVVPESSGKAISHNVTSSAHSPRVAGGKDGAPSSMHPPHTPGKAVQQITLDVGTTQKTSTSSGSVGLDSILSSQAGAAAAAAAAMSASLSQSAQQIRYAPPANNMINPVLATVANALFAARHTVPGSNFVGGSGMQGMIKSSKGKGRQGNFQGGGGDTSPLSPNSSDGDDLFEPPPTEKKAGSAKGASGGGGNISNLFDTLFGSEPVPKPRQQDNNNKPSKPKPQNRPPPRKSQKKEPPGPVSGHAAQCDINLNEDVPASAVELSVQEKLINKINRQERVVEEVKVCLKPHYIKKHVNKEEYKEILRRAVPKICHSKTGEINPFKIRELVDAYVRKFRHNRKKSA